MLIHLNSFECVQAWTENKREEPKAYIFRNMNKFVLIQCLRYGQTTRPITSFIRIQLRVVQCLCVHRQGTCYFSKE